MFEQQKAQDLAEAQFNLNKILLDEIKDVDFNEVLHESEHYAVRPCIVIERSGQMIAVYGIYNKSTGIREAETRQMGGAEEYVKVLTKARNGEFDDLPGLTVPDDATVN